tara:strand:+ start:685 stop:1497 length:813 start_codon:yes stop_codon:yes gene_type:complete
MGWTVVEPLSPGLFQIDPAIYDAETQVFAVPIVGKTIKAVVKAIQEKIGKQVAEKVQKEVAEKIGKEVSESAAQSATDDVMEEAFEKTMREQNPDFWAWKEGGEVGPRPALKVSGDAFDNAVAKNAQELASEKLTKELGGEAGEDVVGEAGEQTVKEMTPQQLALKDSVDRLAGKGVFYGAFGLTAFAILSPMSEALGDGVGDLIEALTGEDCEAIENEEDKKRCQDRADQKLMLFGAGSLAVVGLLGAFVITRLIPKKEPKEDEEESEE